MQSSAKNYFNTVLKSFKDVFTNPVYILISTVSFLIVLFIASWIPNLSWVIDLVGNESFSVYDRLNLIIRSFANLSLQSPVLMVIVSVLFGAHISMTVFYFRRRIDIARAGGGGLAGLISGLVGIGCPVCGSAILSSIFGAGIATGFIGALPLRGLEFGLISIVLISASIIYLALKSQGSIVCANKNIQ